MKKFLVLLSAAVLAFVLPATAQQRGASNARPAANAPRANEGHIPPPPTPRNTTTAQRPQYGSQPNQARSDGERRLNGHINDTQHVNHDIWYGHDAPSDPRYHIAQPFAHGHFANSGVNYRYSISRIDAANHEFWFPGGGYWMVATWDWATFSDWCWNCGDDFVVYEDTDHPGWYLLYDVDTGEYVHVQYMGM